MEAIRRVSTITCLGALAPVAWGTTYVVTTELLPPGRPMTASVLRALPAGLLLLALTRQWPRQWGRLILLATMNIGAFFPLLFIGAYRLPGGLAAVVGAAQPLIVALSALLLTQVRTSRRQVAWACVAAAGVMVAVSTGTLHVDGWGLAAAFAGTVCMAVGITLTRAWGATEGLTGLASTGWQLLIGGLMIVPLVPVIDHAPMRYDLSALLGFGWLGLVGGAVAYAVWFYAARHLPPTSTSLLGTLSPVTAAVLGWALLAQEFTAVQAAGFAVALIAVVFGQRVPRHPSGRGRDLSPRRPARRVAGPDASAPRGVDVERPAGVPARLGGAAAGSSAVIAEAKARCPDPLVRRQVGEPAALCRAQGDD